MSVVLVVGTLVFFVLVASVLVQVRQRLEVGDLWYGLVPVGAAGALVAFLVQMGLMMVYAIAAGVPWTMTQAQMDARLDLMLFNTVVIGVLLEVSKVAGSESAREASSFLPKRALCSRLIER